jgi:demethylmenaquinone methyltransferase/2-methoxy-6-polyprenyl-1,4-benzoquinol methylase
MNAPTPVDGSGAMFDPIAPRYDLLNRVISFGLDQGWRRRLVASLGINGPARVLDLATGTADVAITIAQTHREAEVVGVDPSTGMLEVGRRKVASFGLPGRVSLEVGDAQALTYADGSFDGITIAFGIRNVPDRAKALREMKRVTRAGGHIGILELTEPTQGVLAALARIHVHYGVPAIGALLSGPKQYSYLRRSIAAFPSAPAFAEMMREAGLKVVAVEKLGFGAAHLFVGTP